jgi:hypothetical protein
MDGRYYVAREERTWILWDDGAVELTIESGSSRGAKFKPDDRYLCEGAYRRKNLRRFVSAVRRLGACARSVWPEADEPYQRGKVRYHLEYEAPDIGKCDTTIPGQPWFIPLHLTRVAQAWGVFEQSVCGSCEVPVGDEELPGYRGRAEGRWGK